MSLSRLQIAAKVRRELAAYSRKHDAGYSEKKSGEIWFRCPYHANGRERTPSMRMNINVSSKRFFTFHCFGCSAKGKWPELAGKLHCDPIVDPEDPTAIYDEEAIPLFIDTGTKGLFGDSSPDYELPSGVPWPENMPWRTIDGITVNRVGGVLFLDTVKTKRETLRKERLFFPLSETGVIYGGVRANIQAEKGGNYFNSYGLESSKHLLFLDISRQILENQSPRIAFISEGPRDALNPLQYGYASVCNLGAVNSWKADKVDLLLSLRLDLLIMAFDGDEPGRAAANAACADIDDLIAVHDIIFPTEIKNGKATKRYDLSDLSKERIMKLVAEACAANGLTPPAAHRWEKFRKSVWSI